MRSSAGCACNDPLAPAYSRTRLCGVCVRLLSVRPHPRHHGDAVAGPDDGMGDLGGEGGTEEERISDLESALEELKAEFEQLMAGEDGEAEHDGEDEFDGEEGDDEEGDDEEGDDEEGDEEGNPFGGDDEEDESMGFRESRQMTREYKEKVGNDWQGNSMKSPKPVGSGSGEHAGQTSVGDSRSVGLQNPKGRPSTTASAHNILGSGGAGGGENTGTSPNGKTGGLAGSVKGKFTKGEHNVDGKETGLRTLEKKTGWPSNNKSAGPVGSGSGDKAGQTSVGDVKSPLNGAPGRHA